MIPEHAWVGHEIEIIGAVCGHDQLIQIAGAVHGYDWVNKIPEAVDVTDTAAIFGDHG
jgi:hypothetical protein